MMRKVKILEAGDSKFLEGELVHKLDFKEENDRLYHLKIVEDSGDSEEERFQIGSEVGLKENVIIGHQIPAGTGKKYKNVIVGSKRELDLLNKENESVEVTDEKEK